MRVGVNLTWLEPGQVGGSEEATTSLLRAVLDDDPSVIGVELHLLVAPGFGDAHADLLERCTHTVSPTPNRSRVRRVLSDNTWLRGAVDAAGVDLVHHAGGVVPPALRTRCTLTIHDVQPLDHPEHFPLAKRWYLRVLLGQSVRRARRVAVPSAAVRDRIVDRLGADPDRIDVVPWPLGPVSDAPPEETAARLAETGVTAPYVLYPAIAYPHKRHRLLVDAWLASRRRGVEVDLVLTGRPGPCLDDAVDAARLGGHGDHLHVLGRVARGTLDALYRSAVATVFPSAYEGFGLPVAESLQRRTAVVAAPLPAYDPLMPGILTVDADTPDAWSDAITRVVDDAPLRAELVSGGLAAVAELTPERAATAQLTSWRRAVAEGRP